MNSKADTVLIAYVPAPHRGYLELFRKYAGSTLYILGADFIAEYPSLTRHLPGVNPETVARMLRPLCFFSDIRILTKDRMEGAKAFGHIVMPDEDVAHSLVEHHFKDCRVEFDGSWRLRWDWKASTAHKRPEEEAVVSLDVFDQALMRKARGISARSPDWWRQIGALLVRNGSVQVAAFNKHLPSEQSAYLCGDPRSNFEPGQCIDASLALHAEAGVVAAAARRGFSTKGCDLYVTTFPCPPCASLCAEAEFKRLFYMDGYSLIAGAETLRRKGVEIIRVLP